MTTQTNTWTPAVWEAINTLAELDLTHYRNHVHDREAFLGTARAKRVAQHHKLIAKMLANGNPTTDEILQACNPAPAAIAPENARRRDYDRTSEACPTCDSLRFVPVMQDVERWTPCPTCNPRSAARSPATPSSKAPDRPSSATGAQPGCSWTPPTVAKLGNLSTSVTNRSPSGSAAC